MARGALRGAFSAALGLTVLQAVVSHGGSSAIAGAFGVVTGLVDRVFDPNVPAIPDRRDGSTSGRSVPNVAGAATAAGSRIVATNSTPLRVVDGRRLFPNQTE